MSEKRVRTSGPWTTVGMVFGAVALVIAAVHYWAGPFAPPPKRDVRSIAKSWKKKALSVLRGKKVEVRARRAQRWDIDRILKLVAIVLGVFGGVLGIIGFAQRESKRAAITAAALGAGAASFQYLIFAAGIAFLVIVLLTVFDAFG